MNADALSRNLVSSADGSGDKQVIEDTRPCNDLPSMCLVLAGWGAQAMPHPVICRKRDGIYRHILVYGTRGCAIVWHILVPYNGCSKKKQAIQPQKTVVYINRSSTSISNRMTSYIWW